MKTKTLWIFLVFIVFLPVSLNAKSAEIASSNTVGDHLRFSTDVFGFVSTSIAPGIDKSPKCVGEGTKYVIRNIGEKETIVDFIDVVRPSSKSHCGDAEVPVASGAYMITNDKLINVYSKADGLAFGALIVPFKFRLGDDKKIVSSSTIAPFIGIRWNKLQGYGFEGMVVVSAGLGLVPVYDSASKTTDSKSAFSTSVGFKVTSIKNSNFSAGVLFGKDFLSSSDRASDPSVNKPWVSLWLGVSN